MAADREGDAKFTPKDIDPTLCSHVIIGYAGIAFNIISQTGQNDDGKYVRPLVYSVDNNNINNNNIECKVRAE